jgi:hypothetical protein
MAASHTWLLAAALTVVAPSSTPARAADEWELLGSRRVRFSGERDVIEVGAREGAYRAIKIEVEGGNLEMYDIRLMFGDGGTWSPQTRVRFREGSWSRTIDLPGRARVIRRITFAYRSELRGGRATVRVYGRSAGPDRRDVRDQRDGEDRREGEYRRDDAEGPPRGAPGLAGWAHLGTRQVDFRLDHDAVVAAGTGAFRRIRIDVEGSDLEMFAVKVTFGNGASVSPPTRLLFKEGSRSRVIDLPGTARTIRRIDFFYRSVGGARRGNATVHVYGRR